MCRKCAGGGRVESGSKKDAIRRAGARWARARGPGRPSRANEYAFRSLSPPLLSLYEPRGGARVGGPRVPHGHLTPFAAVGPKANALPEGIGFLGFTPCASTTFAIISSVVIFLSYRST